MINAHQILAAIREADDEKHPADQLGWFDEEDPSKVMVDGTVNFVRVAEILTDMLEAEQEG